MLEHFMVVRPSGVGIVYTGDNVEEIRKHLPEKFAIVDVTIDSKVSRGFTSYFSGKNAHLTILNKNDIIMFHKDSAGNSTYAYVGTPTDTLIRAKDYMELYKKVSKNNKELVAEPW